MTPTSPPIETIREIRDQCLCLAAQRAARRLARRFDRLFAPLGITNGQFSMMCALSGDWRPRQGELADFLGMDATTMTAACKALVKRELIEMLPDDTDARVRRPALTPAGRSVVAQAVPLWKAEHGRLQSETDEAADPVLLARQLASLGLD